MGTNRISDFDKNPSVEEIRSATKTLLDEYGFFGAVLFGSYAEGTASDNSDVDIYLKVPAGARTKDVFNFAYDLGEVIGKTVDAYGSHEVPEASALYDQIKAKGVAL